ncbi:Uu.00g140920.m01.CDS01 [Anthostomella pinea]|uniref:Uu.00g140920.m01.CDS01 n=1 Tax=Anthostomella pinea TaxID=933095 RepID=A0AAI8VQA0_9PEZI|nr:Uu.00g140920.m01.CDS01 [Anthostomella pinea]
MPSSKPKPSEVAAETKRHYIPAIRSEYAHQWPTHSYLFQKPLEQIPLNSLSQLPPPPEFYVCPGDPVDFTIDWKERVSTRIPFICAANDKRPGGDWETGVVGYEERLCRRSNLSATLSTPGPGSEVDYNYPIPSEGGIYSEYVVVFRGPHDQYKKLDQWYDLPVVSMPAARWPKLSQMGSKYAFPLERDLVKNKIRAALRICVYYGHRSVVIGDFGLGNGHRNPPQEIAELWREVFLYDPDIRGRFDYVAFVFEDLYQRTAKLILDDIAKKSKGGHSSSSKGKSKSHGSSSSSSAGGPTVPSDFEIFQHVFDASEIQGVMSRPDPRYGISMLTS